MRINEIQDVLKTQIVLGKTPKGRNLTEFAKESISSCMSDAGNQDADAVECKNCGMIISVLLIADGCPNCGGLDFNYDITKEK